VASDSAQSPGISAGSARADDRLDRGTKLLGSGELIEHRLAKLSVV